MGVTYCDIAEAEVAAAVHRAIDLGINCFDTAPAYEEVTPRLCWADPWAQGGRMCSSLPSAAWAMLTGRWAGTAGWHPSSLP